MIHRQTLQALLRFLGLFTVFLHARLLRFINVCGSIGSEGGDIPITRTRQRPNVRDEVFDREKNRPDSFSSCLLWMDDNFRLPEWLAYHYYEMNLRYLVIHPDPRSKGSPRPVLDQWRDRIHIVEWEDPSTFTVNTFTSDQIEDHGNLTKEEKSRLVQERTKQFFRRQIDFYHGCAVHMKLANRTWTSFHDSDEFMVVVSQTNRNSAFDIDGLGEEASPYIPEEGPGRALKVVQRYSHSGRDAGPDGASLGPAKDATQYESHTEWDVWFSALPCVVLPRVWMGTAPDPDNAADRDAPLPSFLDPHRFDTLRYRVQGTERHEPGGPGKAIVDVSRLPDNAIEVAWSGNSRAGVHRPFGDLCTNAWAPANGLPLAFHHYVGSWEAFSYRDDVRRGVERTDARWRALSALRGGGINDDARGGIRGFVRMVGEVAAQELLRDAGLPHNYTKPANDTSEWELLGAA